MAINWLSELDLLKYLLNTKVNTHAQQRMKLELILKKHLSLFPHVSVTTPTQRQEFSSRRRVLK